MRALTSAELSAVSGGNCDVFGDGQVWALDGQEVWVYDYYTNELLAYGWCMSNGNMNWWK